MDEAEEACRQALDKRPSCTKARFRRGQARLALGRPIEAAADFGEVCVLEPNNAEATKMLRRAREEGHQAPQSVVVETCSHENVESETSSTVVASTTHSSREAPLPRKHTSTTSTTSSRQMLIDEPGEEEKESGDVTQNIPVEAECAPSPPSVPSFMVPGWLTSAEREQGGQAHENGQLDDNVDHGGSDADKSGDAQDAVSVSRLVSQLSAAQKAGSTTGRRGTSPSASSGTIIAAAAQAEWSHMQLEEASKVQESLRRWSAKSSGGATHPAAEATTKTAVAAAVTKGKLVDTKRRGSQGKAATKKGHARTPTNTKEAVGKASDWWADLEEEESNVREAFRAKLSIGEKLPTKKKAKETEKEKAKRKKKAASRLRSDVPP